MMSNAVTGSTLIELLKNHLDMRPDALACSSAGRTLSFGDVDRCSSQIANALAAMGIHKGDRVACLTKHHVECYLLTLAASKIGAVCVPVNWRSSAEEIEYIITHCEARMVMSDEMFIDKLGRNIEAAMPLVRQIVCTEKQSGDLPSFAAWYGVHFDHCTVNSSEPDDAALQIYSSGTTGVPKGIVLSHRNLVSAAQTTSDEMHFGPSGVLSNILPTFHISGMLMLAVSLYAGGHTRAYPEFDPADFIESIGRDGITHAVLVPAMLLFTLASPVLLNGNYSTLKLITYGGAPVSEPVLQQAIEAFKCDFLQLYGLTEVSGVVTFLRPEDHHRATSGQAELLRSSGRPAKGTEIRIVDPVTFRDQAEGEAGEVWVKSDRNLIEYWSDLSATSAAYPEGREEGWFRTGDVARVQQGYVYLMDRLKDMIISGGENIYTAEVEKVLAKHPSVGDCAVIGVPDDVWGESVKACVVLKAGARATGTEIIEWMREKMAHYKCPKSIDFMDALPRNPNGKILKAALRASYWAGRERAVN